MDIDGLIEYHDKAYVIWELKYERVPLLMGQQLALERLTDDLSKIKPTLCVIATHDTSNPERDIPADRATVLQYRQNRVWYKPNQTRSLKDLVDNFLAETDERVGC